MNYRHVYMLIIEHAKSEEKLGLRKKGIGKYYERHHILPKSLFSLWSKRESNLVLLTAREHFFCHQLLTKIYPCRQMYSALFYLAIDNKHNCSSREYQYIREVFAKKQSEHKKGRPCKHTITQAVLDGRKRAGEKRKGRIPWNKGKHNIYSEETLLKIREARAKQDMSWRKDPEKSKEFRQKLSKANKGRKLGPAWNKGKKMNYSEEAKKAIGKKGIKIWHKGEQHIKSFECPGPDWLPGFSEARKAIYRKPKHKKRTYVAAENTQAAESRIRDADMAEKFVEFSKNQILTEASSAMLAQSLNVNRSAVAKLLG